MPVFRTLRQKSLPHARSLTHGERGQAAVMIGAMMLTFILLFAFVVNTGMLVHAKINLQNAADLAAYSGAATQARQLTQISYLNYEMRRQYKKFLFRYYVVGNMAQKGAAEAAWGSGTYMWSPNGVNNYGVPSVCIVFNSQDNYCQVVQLPEIQQPNSSPLDAINSTLITQLQALESIREQNCGAIADANLTVLMLWLYNTDPTLSNLEQSGPAGGGAGQPLAGVVDVTKAVTQGLGLVPREMLLHQRIKTLEGYVNQPAVVGANLSQVQSWGSAADPATNERTIQAFYSAYYTLGTHTFSAGDITMDELLPQTLIHLKDIPVSFDSYAVTYELPNGAQSAANAKGSHCQSILTPITVVGLPIGVYKDPQDLTYYAVRLKEAAHIMFSPFGDMTLKAYAAARPFGSRIGPAYTAENFTNAGQPGGNFLDPGGFANSIVGSLPNLPVTEGDSTAGGWNQSSVLNTFYTQLDPPEAGKASSVTGPAFLQGERVAMAPNPGEGYYYNIPNDLVNDPIIKNFDSTGDLVMWAPVFPPGQTGNISDELKGMFQNIFDQAPVPGEHVNPTSQANMQGLQNQIVTGLTTYVGLLQQSAGETNCASGCRGEGMNTVPLGNPFVDYNLAKITLPSTYMPTDPKLVRTSWVSQADSEGITPYGRVGYSVKFVSFDSLLHPGLSTPQEHSTNSGFGDADAERDLPYLKH